MGNKRNIPLSGATVEEVPGLYGPFQVSERLIQKIWYRQDFETHGLDSVEGNSIRVLSSGKWNLSAEGPDFLGAEMEIDGELLHGDVEIHFKKTDWRNHGHHLNPDFARVILHVVLFPFRVEHAKGKTVAIKGKHPPTLVLLPLLTGSIEEYAERDAIEVLGEFGMEDAVADWMEMPLVERKSRLLLYARQRWEKKLAHVQKRLSTETFSEVCHQLTLEILGYRRNRTPMARLAISHPLADLSSGKLNAETLFNGREGEWKLSGLRPANNPKVRLEQYLGLATSRPDWPECLAGITFVSAEAGSSRKSLKLSELRKRISSEVLAGEIGGSRLDTLVVDGFLPLLSVYLQSDLFPHWRHWYAGDFPSMLKSFLRQCQLSGPQTGEPFSNGSFQGTLGHFLERNLV